MENYLQKLKRFLGVGRNPLGLLSSKDRSVFKKCKFTSKKSDPVSVRCKAFGSNAVYIRPGTSDAQVLEDTLIGAYHLPDRSLPSAPIILDLGANIGLVAMHYASLYPQSRIVCVELDQGNIEILLKNIEPFMDRITVIHAAVWHHDGVVAYGGGEEWGFAVNENSELSIHHVRAMRIESILEEAGVDRPDFVKMDIEGAEQRVVKHDAGWLRRIEFLQCEVHTPSTPASISAELQRAGFLTSLHARHWASINAWRTSSR
jgi:FkbM family methyltransferase